MLTWLKPDVQGSVFMAMWRTHARVFIMVGFIKLFDNILTFISPLLLERLLLSLQSGASAGAALGTPHHQLAGALGCKVPNAPADILASAPGEPLMYALAMFLVGVTETLVNNRQMHYSMRMVMQLKVRATAGRAHI